eukprot:5109947-Alexandrium_andersonii.AAC.1
MAYMAPKRSRAAARDAALAEWATTTNRKRRKVLFTCACRLLLLGEGELPICCLVVVNEYWPNPLGAVRAVEVLQAAGRDQVREVVTAHDGH